MKSSSGLKPKPRPAGRPDLQRPGLTTIAVGGCRAYGRGMILQRIFRLFETWIDPYTEATDAHPAPNAIGYMIHFVRQAKWPFVAMIVLGGFVAFLEVALFYFVGRLVDLLEVHGCQRRLVRTDRSSRRRAALHAGRGACRPVPWWRRWSRLSKSRLSFRVFSTSSDGRPIGTSPGKACPSFMMNSPAGVVTKVWQSGQALGDFMVSLLQVAWFIAIYTVTTLALVAQLDWRLAAIVGLWIVAFALVARHFVPRIRNSGQGHGGGSPPASTARLVDGYANIQTLKLFRP